MGQQTLSPKQRKPPTDSSRLEAFVCWLSAVCAPVAQRIEQTPRKVFVAGSNPAGGKFGIHSKPHAVASSNRMGVRLTQAG
jgi:hypothetical protein